MEPHAVRYTNMLPFAYSPLPPPPSPPPLPAPPRFDYNSMFGGKINKPVSYVEYLNMRPYMSEPKVSTPGVQLGGYSMPMGGHRSGL